METTKGFSFLARVTSRQIESEATADPPGLSTRNTMASTDLSWRARRIQREIVSLPIMPYMPLPLMMGPIP